MCHSLSAPCTAVDVTDDGNLTSSCYRVPTIGLGARRGLCDSDVLQRTADYVTAMLLVKT